MTGSEPHSAPVVEQEGRALRVLVVEDDADTAGSLALLLRQDRHDVRLAADGPAALAAAQAARPDVVLLDLGLPGMDGWQVAEHLRERLARTPPFLIAVTGRGRKADRRRSGEAGIDLHLVKPADPDLLRRLLARFSRVVLPASGGSGADC